MRRVSQRGAVLLTVFGIVSLSGTGVGQIREVENDFALSEDGSVQLWHDGLPQSAVRDYLDRLGFEAGTSPGANATVTGTDRFHGRAELFTDWSSYSVEVDSPYRSVEFYRIFDQTMRVRTELTPEGVRVTDDRGGSRLEVERKFPVASCDRGSHGDIVCELPFLDYAADNVGLLVEYLRDHQGYPKAVRVGENLLLRYIFETEPVHDARGDLRRVPDAWELLDLRSGAVVLTSEVGARVAIEPERFSISVGAQVQFPATGIAGSDGVYKPAVFAVHGRLYGVVGGADQWSFYDARRQERYALLPLEAGDALWRSINAKGDYEDTAYRLRVDYTDHAVRVEIYADSRRSLVVQAPRDADSLEPVQLIQPNIGLPYRVRHQDSRVDLRSEFRERLPVMSSPAHPGIRALGMNRPHAIMEASKEEEEDKDDGRDGDGELFFGGGGTGPPPGCEVNEDGEVTACDGEEIVVIDDEPKPPPTPTTPPTTNPPPQPPQPPPPGPSNQGTKAAKLSNAVSNARKRARKKGCKLYWRTPFSQMEARSTIGQVVDGGPKCSDPRRPYAHVDRIGGSTIHVCPPFYNQAPAGRELTILHEGFHLSGVRHSDVGGSAAMNAQIRQNCF